MNVVCKMHIESVDIFLLQFDGRVLSIKCCNSFDQFDNILFICYNKTVWPTIPSHSFFVDKF